MTSSALPELLEAFPLPDDAVVLPQGRAAGSDRELAVAGLQQAIEERRLTLPLGPQLELANPQRLLSLNRFAVQLVCGGYGSDQLRVPLAPWQSAATAPQLLLAALVEDENGVVWFPGVLTADELLQAIPPAAGAAAEDGQLLLETSAFSGGIERLLTLVQLLDPEAIPRRALTPPPATPQVVRVLDWLEGLLPPSLGDLGAGLLPVTAGAFRQGGAGTETPAEQALAILAIPLGLTAAGALVSGEASRSCIERFQLLLIPTAERRGGARPGAEQLRLQLVGELQGDLLPDGLVLRAVQGSRHQSVTSATSTLLELELPADPALIEVTLTPPGGAPLVLPPLQLPG